MLKEISLVVIHVICGYFLIAQNTNDIRYIYHLTPTIADIKIDGVADEPDWDNAERAENFILNAPVDNATPSQATVVRMLCDHAHLYLFADCYDDPQYIIQTLKRDGFGDSDEFALLIDPGGKKANGYGFGVNVMGAQTEVIIFPSGSDATWDNRWFSAVKVYEDKWTVEMKIPLKSLRYNENVTTWRVNFARLDPGSNEISVWAAVPRQFDFADIGYYGTLKWPEAPKKQGGNISLIPFTSVRFDKVSDQNEVKLQVGGDVKIALTPSLNLDLTSFSDFSQVEVDVQVTNLTRFNIFFPKGDNSL